MRNVLVVDHDPIAASALARLLRDDGHQVSAFTSADDAMAALEQQPFDIVITDLEAPEVDGFAILCAARSRVPNACVVVVSGKAAEHRASLVGAGACVVADKPLDYAELTAILERCRATDRPARHAGTFVRSAPR